MPWVRSLTSRASASDPGPVDRLDHLFVVTFGRSGSTLVQGLLNALPGTLVRGENGFFLRALFHSHEALARTKNKWSDASELKGPASAFYGAEELDLPAYRAGIRDLVEQQLVGGQGRQELRTVGFKEVLWHEVTEAETDRFLAFMDAVFPRARYVLHRRRNHEDVLVSGFWKRWDPKRAEDALLRVERFQEELAVGREDRTCWTTYEDLTSPDPAVAAEALVGLAQGVGHDPTPALLATLADTVKIGHGPNPSQGQNPARRKSGPA